MRARTGETRCRRCRPATVVWLVRSRRNRSRVPAARHEGCAVATGTREHGGGTLGGGASCHVAIIGAGPYGLAAAAHLRAQNVEARIFGEPMEFWKRHMPRGMFLRSSPSASNLADPDGRLRLDRYQDRKSTRLNSSHLVISYAVFCLKKKKKKKIQDLYATHITDSAQTK